MMEEAAVAIVVDLGLRLEEGFNGGGGVVGFVEEGRGGGSNKVEACLRTLRRVRMRWWW